MRTEFDYIETSSGIKFYPFDARPEEVNILDIAHALSNQCRFGGHPRLFYTVAQHSLFSAQLLKEFGASKIVQLYGLLHDATEGYMIDLPTPIKRNLPEYKKAEEKLHEVIWKALGLRSPTEEEWREVKFVDYLLLHHEANHLLKKAAWADKTIHLKNVEIIEEERHIVKKRYLKLYEQLREELK